MSSEASGSGFSSPGRAHTSCAQLVGGVPQGAEGSYVLASWAWLSAQLSCTAQPWQGHSFLAGYGRLTGAGIRWPLRLSYRQGAEVSRGFLQSQES